MVRTTYFAGECTTRSGGTSLQPPLPFVTTWSNKESGAARWMACHKGGSFVYHMALPCIKRRLSSCAETGRVMFVAGCEKTRVHPNLKRMTCQKCIFVSWIEDGNAKSKSIRMQSDCARVSRKDRGSAQKSQNRKSDLKATSLKNPPLALIHRRTMNTSQ